ncbi:MAG: oligoendopeptidase F, partial [Clostridia bacterium]
MSNTVLKNRKDVLDKFKWKLEDIFPSNEAWEESFFDVTEVINKVSSFQDRLSDDDVLLECLTFDTAVSHDLSRLYQYARMRRDEDTRVDLYQGMSDRAEMLSVKFSSLSSFITPEINSFSEEKLVMLKDSKRFHDYSVYFEEIIRNKNIILSKKEEKLLGELGIFAGTNDEVFSMFDNADIKFAPVEDESGKLVEMSHGVYSMLLQNKNQEVRKRAFESMFGAYRDHINTLAANYAGNVKKDWFFAKTRGFSSALDYSMYKENVPSTCYNKLLKAVSDGTKPMHKYIALRRRILGDKDLNMYDLYVPIVESDGLAMSYEKAVDTVKSALKVMGREYSEVLALAFTNHWVDVFENKGKRSGAYSWGCFGVHPFVLLNYRETSHDVFTIAHELGHSMHSYFSNLEQCEEKAGYEIFVAEIASTVNEVLLLKYLIKTASGDLKKYLLSYYLDMFRTTLFRQTMFAEFEVFAHGLVESSQPITADALSNEYLKLNKKYYGRAVTHNELIKFEWARIPHFYDCFYVYKYATGLTAAVTIADNIINQGENYFKKYKKFLSAGCSLPPLDILRLAEVDLE